MEMKTIKEVKDMTVEELRAHQFKLADEARESAKNEPLMTFEEFKSRIPKRESQSMLSQENRVDK